MDNLNLQNSNTAYVEPMRVKHSGLGIASFVISLVALFNGVALFVFVLSTLDMEERYAVIGGLWMILLLLMTTTGGILGLISFFMKNRKKVFGIIGFIINFIVGFAWFGILAIGLLVSMQGL